MASLGDGEMSPSTVHCFHDFGDDGCKCRFLTLSVGNNQAGLRRASSIKWKMCVKKDSNKKDRYSSECSIKEGVGCEEIVNLNEEQAI